MSLTICSTAVWLRNATTVAGAVSRVSGSNSSTLNLPKSVYVDNNNTIFVLDSGNYRVQRFLSNSTIGLTVINGSNGTQLNQFLSGIFIVI